MLVSYIFTNNLEKKIKHVVNTSCWGRLPDFSDNFDFFNYKITNFKLNFDLLTKTTSQQRSLSCLNCFPVCSLCILELIIKNKTKYPLLSIVIHPTFQVAIFHTADCSRHISLYSSFIKYLPVISDQSAASL